MAEFHYEISQHCEPDANSLFLNLPNAKALFLSCEVNKHV